MSTLDDFIAIPLDICDEIEKEKRETLKRPEHSKNSHHSSTTLINNPLSKRKREELNCNTLSAPNAIPTNNTYNADSVDLTNPLELMQTSPPWIRTERSYSTDLTRRLHEEIIDFVQYVAPTREEHEARMFVVKMIEFVLLQKYPSLHVKIFGSYDTRLYLPNADIDLVIFGSVDCFDKDHSSFSSAKNSNTKSPHTHHYSSKNPPLRKISQLLVKSGIAVGSSVKIISKARVPLIKFTDNLFNFEIDISFNVESGLESAEIMKALVDLLPGIKPLTLVIKQFLSLRQLNEVFSGGLGSYSIALLIVSFLQMHPLVQTKLIKPEENYGVLLLEFFELYGKLFSYESVGISLRNGGFYYDKVKRGWAFPGAERLLLSLEDPQNEENDVAKGSFALSAVKQAFEHSFNLLTAIIREGEYKLRRFKDKQQDREYSNNLRHGAYESSVSHRKRASLPTMDDNPRYEKNNDDNCNNLTPIHPTASLLSSIIHIEDEVIQHREFVRKKFGELERKEKDKPEFTM